MATDLEKGEADPGSDDAPSEQRTSPLRPRRPWYRKKRWVIPIVLLVLLSPDIYSYTTTMMKPSSLPLTVRSVEWLRQHHGNWIVDTVEHFWYSWHAPKPGGPQLKSLPRLGSSPVATNRPSGGHSGKARDTELPPPIAPVFANPLPGEGQWHQTGPPVDGGAPMLVTTFRTERDYPQIVAYVAWFDHTRTDSAYYPGRYEPPSAAARGPMMVPYSQRSRLLATFNSGFIYTDGQNGSSVNGITNEPLKAGLGTLIAYRNGNVDIKTWTGGPDAGPGMAYARQSLPLIVDNGRLNPALNTSNEWGFTLGNAVRVWRTGVGIDRKGNLIFAAADYQTVITLAQILKRAGAVRAIQLDINPEWPTLISYTHKGRLHPNKIVPNYQQPVTRYLVPDDRDFFAVYTKEPGPVTVPFG